MFSYLTDEPGTYVSFYRAKGKTRWVIFDTTSQQPYATLAEGWASDAASASAAADASLRTLGIVNFEAASADEGREHDRIARRISKAKTAVCEERAPRAQEWLYHESYSDDYGEPPRWLKLPITKTTAHRVYFLTSHHDEYIVDGVDVSSQCCVSREALDAGDAWHQHYRLYSEPAYQRKIALGAASASGVPRCLAALGLRFPCTVTQVKSAFKKLATKAHPDQGGSDATFVKLTQDYERALELVSPRRPALETT
jgi:hypothetical protein